MPKNSKQVKEETVPEETFTAPVSEPNLNPGMAAPPKPVVAKGKQIKSATPVKTTGKSRASAPRKPATPRQSRAKGARRSLAGNGAITEDAIRIRAYFISERRRHDGIPGDSAGDWMEARSQLQKEAGKPA